ncbi:MAG: four helix bundle protein [Candidatus Symbiothrix sp.]|jgi:four helix bundle protein|nr:four helix bundle protein [Candidatus Symbiothrix sp.]
MENKKSILQEKSYAFAIRIVRLSQFLQETQREFVLNKQILKSGTAIGALIREAEFAQSNADYINKFSISLKEANESAYWLSLLKDTDYIDVKLYDSFSCDCNELISILVSTIKTLKLRTKN